jgi:signal transduction histidine kinase
MVLVPCLIGSIFQVALDLLWISTSKLTAESHAQNENVVELSAAFKELVLYGYDQMTYKFQNTEDAGKRAVVDRERLLQCTKRLSLGAGQDSRSLADLDQASLMFCQVLSDTEKLTASLNADDFSNNLQRLASFASNLKSGLLLSTQIQASVKRQSLLQDRLRQQQDILNQVIKGWVLFGFAITTVVSVLLLIGFVRDVLIRLRLLTNNARALSRTGKQLSEIGGNDELTYLDSVFHDVASELKSARDQHHMIMQMVAHDLRSPIMATQLYIQVFQELVGPGLTQRAGRWCAAIAASSNQVLAFVTELLTLERVESGDLKLEYSEFGIVDMVEDCKGSLSALANDKAIIIVDDCQDLVLMADRSRVQHVLMNYLSNALKFSPKGATVRVFTRRDVDQSVTVFVEDQGPGLSEEMVNHVFDKFYQGPEQKNQGSGFGLGLSICKKLIESHEGDVGVNSRHGHGSQFWFSLPNRTARSTYKASGGYKPGAGGEGGQFNQENALSDLLRPGLIRQGLILTLLPFVAQALWLVWINGQLSQSENLEKLERKQSDLVATVNGLWLSTFDANSSVAFFILRKDDKFRLLAQKSFLKLRETLATLDTLAAGNTETMGTWRDTRTFVIFEAGRLEQLLTHSSDQSTSSDLGELSKVFGRVEILAARIENVEKGELKRLLEIRRRQDTFLRDMQGFIFGALALNMLVYILLWLFFSNRFLRRLDLLVNCAKQIPSRRPVYGVVTGTDELASLAAQLHKASVDLKEADDQRKAVLSMVTHDIRSPLMAIEISLTMLEKGNLAPPETRDQATASLQSARGNVERVLALVNDLLTLDKLEAGSIELERSDCYSAVLVADAVSSIASLAMVKGIVIERDCVDVPLRIDKGRMIQVLVNIFSNAIKFSPDNSVIVIKAKESREGLRISIKDSGPGMDAETAQRIFDRFFKSGDQKEAAFGLGLAICKLIVDAHGGKIGVETSLGQGSTFWILLP